MSDKLTKAEMERSNKTKHDLDNNKFIAWVKKCIKDKKIRINTYTIVKINDGMMLKMEIERFTVANKSKGIIGGISMGTRTAKGYLSETKCDDLVALLDAIPKKSIQDTRTQNTYITRPEKIIATERTLKEQDLDNLFEE